MLAGAFMLMGGAAAAHPVSFKGGLGIMPEYTPDRRHLEVNYSVTGTQALGVSVMDFDHDDRHATFVLPRFNYRAYRHNAPHSQANLYLSLGLGTAEYRDDWRPAALGAFQADYETRRIYTLLSGDLLQGSGGLDQNFFRYRAGVAPYLGEFDQLHTWLIGQVEYSPEQDRRFTVTPLVRLFYQSYLVEVGSSTRGDIFVAGIFHF